MPILVVEKLTVRFGGLVAVNNVSLSVNKAEIRGLIGPNGAGKTTLFNAVSGLILPESGRVIFSGEDVTGLPPHSRAALGIRRTFQTIQLIQGLTVLENVLIGLHRYTLGTRLWRLVGLDRGRVLESVAQSRVAEVLGFLGLEALILRDVASLSFAQQRYVEIARALVARPTLLLLDEPAAGLSRGQVQELHLLLNKLRDEWNVAILLVEHLVSLVMRTCDRVTVLDQGSVIADGSGEEIMGSHAVKVAYLGQATYAEGH